jgi:hypothetical protein
MTGFLLQDQMDGTTKDILDIIKKEKSERYAIRAINF